MLKQFRATVPFFSQNLKGHLKGHCCPKLFQHTIVCLLALRWKRGRELVHCLYNKTPDGMFMFKIPDFSLTPRLSKQAGLDFGFCVIRSRSPYTCIGDSTGDLRHFDMTVRCAAHYAGAHLKFWQKQKKSQTPQPGIEPGTPANAADALPLRQATPPASLFKILSRLGRLWFFPFLPKLHFQFLFLLSLPLPFLFLWPFACA